MINEPDYKRMLAEAKKLIRLGNLSEARSLLEQIRMQRLGQADPATSLGLPRRLQSAMLRLAKAEGDQIRKIAYQFHLVPPPERLAAYATFSAGDRARMVELSRMPVPACIHQIWLGSRPVPVTVSAWERHASENGYEYRLWREADIERSGYDRNPAFRHMLEAGDFPGAVDAARYLILRDEGGIYLDCDWYPARRRESFRDFLPMTGLCVFAEDTPRNTGAGATLFANSFIATPPGHPVFERLSQALPEIVAELGDVPAWWSTGPLVFTVLARSGPVTLAAASLVAGSMAADAPLEDVDARAGELEALESGLLIAWKPW